MAISLKSFNGGLGNQLFQVATILYFSKKLNKTFHFPKDDISIGYINSPTYLDTILKNLLLSSEYISDISNSKSCILKLDQFVYKDISLIENLNDYDNIIIDGLPMNIEYIYPVIEDLYKYISIIPDKYKEEIIEFKKNFKEEFVNIAICNRRFKEENHSEWAVDKEYYKLAIKSLNLNHENKYIMHVFSDDIEWMKNWFNNYISNIYELFYINIIYHNGVRNNKDDVIHFYGLMQCDHFILTNSTYHYWPCILKYFNNNKRFIVTYPKGIEWLTYIMHPLWIKI